MTTGPTTTTETRATDEDRDDAIAVPLSLLLWGLVTIALAYGVISTLSKVVDLFS
jgi:hypothetical protein